MSGYARGPFGVDWEDRIDFARLRTLEEDGRMCPDFIGPPVAAPKGCRPWYSFHGRKSAGVTVIFGHWAALGLKVGGGVAGLDTGCAGGKELWRPRAPSFAGPVSTRVAHRTTNLW